MKAADLLFSLALIISLCSFAPKPKDNSTCYTSFKDAKGLRATFPPRKAAAAANTQMLDFQRASVEIPAAESYDVAYSNKKKQTFVTLKILSATDQPDLNNKESILEHLKSKNKTLAAASKDLVTLDYNGYRFYGLAAPALSTDTLSLFVCFTEDGDAVYLSFMNATKSFTTMEEFKSLRNGFIGEYSNYLRECTH